MSGNSKKTSKTSNARKSNKLNGNRIRLEGIYRYIDDYNRMVFSFLDNSKCKYSLKNLKYHAGSMDFPFSDEEFWVKYDNPEQYDNLKGHNVDVLIQLKQYRFYNKKTSTLKFGYTFNLLKVDKKDN